MCGARGAWYPTRLTYRRAVVRAFGRETMAMAATWGIWCTEGYWSDARAGETPGPDPLDEGDTAAHFNSKAEAEAGIERRRVEGTELYYEAKEMVHNADPTSVWEDVKDEWSDQINAAFPTRSGSHDEYALAMRMVGHRHSKGELVALVN